MLPICAPCKKIWDDKAYLNQIESYVKDPSETEFSHVICIGCTNKLYHKLYDKNEDPGKQKSEN